MRYISPIFNMKMHILSDLHLEFSDFRPPETDADVVVLAGDIGKGDHGMGWARASFPDQEILYVAGNHEFYGRERLETLAKLRIAARECGVHFLDDETVEIGGVRFLGATLWTDFNLFGKERRQFAMAEGQRGLNDFRVIHEGPAHFSPADSIRLHEKSLAFLERELQRPFDGKTVVVTHHLPSARSVVERFKHDWLSACFASRLDHLFGRPVSLWIHGHTHDSMDYEVMGTRVVCNPRGYVRFNSGPENFDFNPGLVVEI
jgi:predicted phosphodiesterase